ncbi:MAG: hypothetical protein M3O71_19640 [Bacteroidota bacterium]|nr:hypothetical protein [Bacteroidota bacterium]
MIPIYINSKTYFFSIIHVTKQSANTLIYGILLNAHIYYLSKSLGRSDCVQLDSNPLLDVELLTEICDIMTKFEVEYEKYPSLEFINDEIIKVLGAIRMLMLQINLSDTVEGKDKLTSELKAMIKTLPIRPL